MMDIPEVRVEERDGEKAKQDGRVQQEAAVPFPETAGQWDDFITRYSLGEFYRSNFAVPSPSILTPDELADSLATTSITKAATATSDTTLAQQPRTVTPAERLLPTRQGQLALPSQIRLRQSSGGDSSGPESSGTELSDAHPNISISGPSNQDPDIPNIDSATLPTQNTAIECGSRRKSKKGPGRPASGQAMTKENMRRLGQTGQNMDVTTRREDGSVGSSKRRRTDGTRRNGEVELASVGRRSRNSSSDDDEPWVTKRRPPRPQLVSRGSKGSIPSHHSMSGSINGGGVGSIDGVLLESKSNSSTSVSHFEMEYDSIADKKRVREFYEKNGYMPAPRQPSGAARRRLRVVRRLGLEKPEPCHRQTMDRFTRLAVNIFKTKMAIVSVVGKERQTFISEIGLGQDWTEVDVAFCSHTIIGMGKQCLIVPDAQKDWRFKMNPFVQGGSGPIRFYAGAPLVVGKENNTAIIGALCVIDDKPREFSEADQALLRDLAECAVSELELLYSQQSVVDSAKLHQISVDFLRRSLKNRPTERAGTSRGLNTATSSTSSGNGSKKRKEGMDSHVSGDDVDIYDEACLEIRQALDAYAVAVVDLTQFHLFYPAYQSSSTAGSSTRGGSASQQTFGSTTASRGPASTSDSAIADEPEAYAKSSNVKRARKTWAISDPTAPSRTPQVLFIPGRRRSDPKRSKYFNGSRNIAGQDNLAVLGYSSAHDGFAFNFTSSPAARKIISDFIASNVKTRRVWYTRDDSEGIAQSITHLMPPGTETSMAMPVFGFDGQVTFAVVACWTDPLFTYPSGAMQFVETIAGSLLASVMKERLHQAERAQLSFAAAASHELRTPLHQINAAATLLRSALHPHFSTPRSSPSLNPASQAPTASPRPKPSEQMPTEDQIDALAQLEIIEANGLALGNILENIIDSLDIGQLSSRMEQKAVPDGGTQTDLVRPQRTKDFGLVMEQVVLDSVALESKSRRVQGGSSMDGVEVILEMAPRHRGGWMMTDDTGPLVRALGKLIHNACKFTEKGYIHITVQDVSRDVVLPSGYDNSIKISTVSIDIKDSGCGMTSDFLEKEVLQPFTKADPFMPGAGLGLGLAQRMIEILGGKLAIASTIHKGTLIHVEIPLHLLNEDNDSDQDELNGPDFETDGTRPRSPIRQDGIYLAGFDSKDLGTRRVGKSLTRTLKLHFCRVVTEINYASLIVAPDALDQVEVAHLASQARPGVHIIILCKEGAERTYRPETPASTPSDLQATARDLLERIPMTYLKRPLRPSIVRNIVKPADVEPPLRETFVSAVAGGPDARVTQTPGSERPSFRRGSSMTTLRPSPSHPNLDAEILPSPPTSPREPQMSSLRDLPDGAVERSHFVVPVRPGIREQATDPLPAVSDPVGWPDSSDSSSPTAAGRPSLHEAKSTPVVPETKLGDPLRVLVVEDNAVNRKILTTMLKRTACHYAEAVDGQDAVNKFLSFSPDLVLLDINMPHKDGFTAAAEMRQIETAHRRKPSTIIAVTALSGEAQKRRGLLECGITQWKTKPVSLKELKADVERLKVTTT